RLLQQGVSADLIRQQGGGASQFTVTGGVPLASVSQFDLGFFAQDDWRLRPNVTLSMGMRYETQNNIGDRGDFAPRIGIAWGLGGGSQRQPKTVLRAGSGIFYDRFTEDLTLRSRNINAPLPGTFDPAVPGSGTRPYGNIGDIYLYESSGIFNQNQLMTNINARMSRRVQLFGFFVVGSAKSNSDGAGTFPANQ